MLGDTCFFLRPGRSPGVADGALLSYAGAAVMLLIVPGTAPLPASRHVASGLASGEPTRAGAAGAVAPERPFQDAFPGSRRAREIAPGCVRIS